MRLRTQGMTHNKKPLKTAIRKLELIKITSSLTTLSIITLSTATLSIAIQRMSLSKQG
jgi:hypothetical protein